VGGMVRIYPAHFFVRDASQIPDYRLRLFGSDELFGIR
jgi:hypothetical protein